MKPTTQNISAVAMLAVAFVGGALANERQRPHAHCVGVLGPANQNVSVCSKDFPALWRSPQAANGEYIKITGFVTEVQGAMYMFASKDMYIYAAGRGGIKLEFLPGEQKRFEQTIGGDYAITVAGQFFAGGMRVETGSIGRIVVLSGRFWRQEMPGSRPPLPSK